MYFRESIFSALINTVAVFYYGRQTHVACVFHVTYVHFIHLCIEHKWKANCFVFKICTLMK